MLISIVPSGNVYRDAVDVRDEKCEEGEIDLLRLPRQMALASTLNSPSPAFSEFWSLGNLSPSKSERGFRTVVIAQEQDRERLALFIVFTSIRNIRPPITESRSTVKSLSHGGISKRSATRIDVVLPEAASNFLQFKVCHKIFQKGH
jgi:hypothetical protein